MEKKLLEVSKKTITSLNNMTKELTKTSFALKTLIMVLNHLKKKYPFQFTIMRIINDIQYGFNVLWYSKI